MIYVAGRVTHPPRLTLRADQGICLGEKTVSIAGLETHNGEKLF